MAGKSNKKSAAKKVATRVRSAKTAAKKGATAVPKGGSGAITAKTSRHGAADPTEGRAKIAKPKVASSVRTRAKVATEDHAAKVAKPKVATEHRAAKVAKPKVATRVRSARKVGSGTLEAPPPSSKRRTTRSEPDRAQGTGTPSAKSRPAPRSSGPGSAARKLDQKIAELGDWRGERLAELRKLIHEVDPEVIEEWKWMGTPVWSHDGMYVLANAHKDKVKLTFFHGARLRDPKGLFNAGLGGGKWRAIDLREGDRIDTGALKALLREAVVFNQRNTVPKSRGSRG